ncbi:MAG: nitroreductase family protein [Patescibacteria group bacterium]|nr:nitroreductase family protein [Patescibacteria group bacterium]
MSWSDGYTENQYARWYTHSILMDTIKAIKTRYSCRNYSSRKIPKATIRKLLRLANLAPSGCNLQNRHFLVITKKEDQQFLSEMNNQPHIAQAPVSIIVLTHLNHYNTPKNYLKIMESFDMTSWGALSSGYSGNKKFMEEYRKFSKLLIPISDATASTSTLLLAANALGINSCWVGIFDEEQIKERFKIPEKFSVVSVVLLGYEKEKPKWRAGRKNIKELVHWDTWK